MFGHKLMYTTANLLPRSVPRIYIPGIYYNIYNIYLQQYLVMHTLVRLVYATRAALYVVAIICTILLLMLKLCTSTRY